MEEYGHFEEIRSISKVAKELPAEQREVVIQQRLLRITKQSLEPSLPKEEQSVSFNSIETKLKSLKIESCTEEDIESLLKDLDSIAVKPNSIYEKKKQKLKEKLNHFYKNVKENKPKEKDLVAELEDRFVACKSIATNLDSNDIYIKLCNFLTALKHHLCNADLVEDQANRREVLLRNIDAFSAEIREQKENCFDSVEEDLKVAAAEWKISQKEFFSESSDQFSNQDSSKLQQSSIMSIIKEGRIGKGAATLLESANSLEGDSKQEAVVLKSAEKVSMQHTFEITENTQKEIFSESSGQEIAGFSRQESYSRLQQSPSIIETSLMPTRIVKASVTQLECASDEKLAYSPDIGESKQAAVVLKSAEEKWEASTQKEVFSENYKENSSVSVASSVTQRSFPIQDEVSDEVWVENCFINLSKKGPNGASISTDFKEESNEETKWETFTKKEAISENHKESSSSSVSFNQESYSKIQQSSTTESLGIQEVEDSDEVWMEKYSVNLTKYNRPDEDLESTKKEDEVMDETLKWTQVPCQVNEGFEDFDPNVAPANSLEFLQAVEDYSKKLETLVVRYRGQSCCVEYFNLDKKLMTLIEHLDNFDCRGSIEMLMKKIQVIEYVRQLHKRLDSRLNI